MLGMFWRFINCLHIYVEEENETSGLALAKCI